MWFVYINNEKHSVWNTKTEAIKQIEVLINNGYRNVYYDEIKTESYNNGHYFV